MALLNAEIELNVCMHACVFENVRLCFTSSGPHLFSAPDTEPDRRTWRAAGILDEATRACY